MKEKVESFIQQIEKYHKGNRDVIVKILSVYFSGGNVLINDVPGTGKSNLSKIIAKSIDASVSRIQFTSDLMASDIIGVKIYDPILKEWSVSKGPIFSDIVFADEINRAPPQTQSALLEVMSEKQVSIEGETFKLSNEHFVIATQNPSEFSGTYPLPEAQLDRFTSCLTLGYLSPEDEIAVIMDNGKNNIEDISPVLSSNDVSKIKKEIDNVIFSKDIAGIIVKILNESRSFADKGELKNGLSVRSGIALKNMSKAYAYIKGYSFVDPDMILSLAPDVLKHRLSHPEKLDEIIANIFKGVYEKTR